MTTIHPQMGREPLSIGSDYEIVWRSGPRLGLVVSLVEVGYTRKEDIVTELGRLPIYPSIAERRNFWQIARERLDYELDQEFLSDIRTDAERWLQNLAPEPEPDPLAAGAETFVTWRSEHATSDSEELRYLMFREEQPLLRLAQWLVTAPPAVGAWLGELDDELNASTQSEPRRPTPWHNYPQEPGGYINSDLVNGVRKGYLSKDDAEKMVKLNTDRHAAYAADLERYPTEHAEWLRKRTRLVRDLVLHAPPQVRAWLESNPPPEN